MVRYYKQGGKWLPIPTGKTTAVDIAPSTVFNEQGVMRSIHLDKKDIVAASQEFVRQEKANLEVLKQFEAKGSELGFTLDEGIPEFGQFTAELMSEFKEDLPMELAKTGPASAWPRMAKNVYTVTRDMTVAYTGQAEAVFDFTFTKQYFQHLAWELSYIYGPLSGKRPSIKPLDRKWAMQFEESVRKFAERVGQFYEKMFYEGGYEPKWEQLCKVTIALRQSMPAHTTKTGTKGGPPAIGLTKVLVHTGSMAGFQMNLKNRMRSMGNLDWMIILAQGGDALKFRVHEYGMDIAITKNMRMFLNSQGWHIKADKKFIHIPKRPILGPLIAKLRENAKSIILEIGSKNKSRTPYTLAEKVMWKMTDYADYKLQSRQWTMAEYNKFARMPAEDKYMKLYGTPWPYSFKPFRGYSTVGRTG